MRNVHLDGYTVIYGGSFNPPHIGHQMSCLFLLEALNATAVWLMPSQTHPFGKELLPFPHRFAMCEAMASPLGEKVKVSDVEEKLGGKGRTYDTLTYLKDLYPERHFAFAIGADLLTEIDSWYRSQELKQEYKIVALGRCGFDDADLDLVALPKVASREIRERLHKGESILGLVPTCVATYIEKEGIYK
ncbi:nicotinate (nicotinamide) nucleotide adenylyltransferase [Myxococcota bacterium]|nr:nicotinate (nicotinamide) nucleotide adenylyltransferase [Myxococcota bacterium]